MALPLGKLTILIGAGIVGSVLAKEGAPNVSNFLSGAFKIVMKQMKQESSTKSTIKPPNDSLLKQVNSLRQELQLLATNRPVTIVTSSSSGSNKYGIVVVIVVVGYGYIWWKGWRLPDLMFATRRSLTDACASVSKQLESVYSSISATKRHLSSRLDRVDCKIEECTDNTATTREEVSELRGEVRTIGDNFQSVHRVVQSLETKITRIEGKQNDTTLGVGKLVAFVRNIENGSSIDQIEAEASSSSRPALELPQATPYRAKSLPPIPSPEPSSPATSNGFQQRARPNAISAGGLKEFGGISDVVETSNQSGGQDRRAGRPVEETRTEHSGSGIFGKVSGISAAFLTMSRSAMQSFK